MKCKKPILFLLFSFLLCSTKSQTITNVVAKQDGDNVLITYYLECEGDAIISISFSEDGGSTFKGPLKSITGDNGAGIKPGSKTIIWNTLKDQTLLVGDNIVFRVSMPSKFGKFTDSRDGKTYKTIKIGKQIWMAENLAYKPSNGNYWVYKNIESNLAENGCLYDWYTAKTVSPSGWHLPTDEEWETLISFLGGKENACSKIKETVTNNRNVGTKVSGNETGFTAILSGIRTNFGMFTGIGGSGYWWTSSESTAAWGWSWYILNGDKNVTRGHFYKEIGFSVRCIKDE
jgi:uncharacterized protein (TIGR02145 family)